MHFFKIALISLSAALMTEAAEASITITSNSIGAYASDGVAGSSSNSFNGTTIPTSTMLDVIDGAAHSQHIIDWSTAGGQTILSLDMDHQRAGTQFSGQMQTSLYFTANSSTPYELAGQYHATDIGAIQSGQVRLEAGVHDLTANAFLAFSFQTSRSRTTSNSLWALQGETPALLF